jgi:hypothetical protein
MIFVALLFIILGILVKHAKMYFLIAGYNTMSSEKKAEIDIKKLANLLKNVFFGMAFLMIIGYIISKLLENPMIENIAFFGAILIGIPYLLVTSNSDKYKL